MSEPRDHASASGGMPPAALERYIHELMIRHGAAWLLSLGHQHDAARSEDALLFALHQLALSCRHHPPPDKPYAWVLVAARRRAVNAVIAERRHDKAVRAASESSRHPFPADPVETLAAKEKRQRLLRRVDQLPARQRRAFSLRFLEGKNFGAIGGIMGCSAATARATVRDALRALRKHSFD